MTVAPACGRGWLQACAWLALIAALTGCAGTPPALPGDRLSGRLSLRIEGQPERSVSADFDLTGSAEQGELTLSGPLGTTAARARWSPTEAVLTTPQGESRESDLNALTQRALGEALPVGAWFDWLRGRPWPVLPSAPLPNGMAGFEQLGWQVQLAQQALGVIEARRLMPPVVTVRVRLATP